MQKSGREAPADAKILLICQTINKEVGYTLLINKYKSELKRYILSIVKDTSTTNDILQNIFIKVWLNIEKIEPTNFKGWLFRIARNKTMHELNCKKEYVCVEHQSTIDKSEWFNHPGSHIKNVLESCIIRLPRQQQAIFRAKYFMTNTDQGIADGMKLTLGGVRSSYCIAMKKVKLMLQEEE